MDQVVSEEINNTLVNQENFRKIGLEYVDILLRGNEGDSFKLNHLN